MKSLLISCFVLAINLPSYGQQIIPPKDIQIKMAVLAAPEESRKGAMVYGYGAEGQLTVLREGENEMICTGDDPDKDGLNVACYQKELEAFMARGRELKKEGKTFREIFDTREEEVKEGILKMPDNGATLYVFSADEKDVNWSNGEVENGSFRYVVYIPYATRESTGLPLRPEAPGMPWIMDPGTHRAHIMITPPKE
ncbi:hypothetical protein FKX85_16215 [Echinicola soli]|uniref:Uncharacterized protein n=1 Tax=Echinicola soli TaxID=2591634 RepID=A0A514CL16_9BACT|nr:hypothetical protein [Echinicola soli]QDH80502.1 hypothetical protein FKX85_16215 [Echinicola soli]